MKKSRAQKDILYISISSFVLVVLWIGFNLYHAHATSTIAPDLKLQIAPINPRFDTAIINKLKTREKIAPLYEARDASPSATVTITPAESVTVTPSTRETTRPTNSLAPPAL